MTFAMAPPPGLFLDGLLKLWIIALWFLRHCRQRRRLKHSTLTTRREYFQERILAWSHNSINRLITHRYARGARCMLLVNHFKGVISWHLFSANTLLWNYSFLLSSTPQLSLIVCVFPQNCCSTETYPTLLLMQCKDELVCRRLLPNWVQFENAFF